MPFRRAPNCATGPLGLELPLYRNARASARQVSQEMERGTEKQFRFSMWKASESVIRQPRIWWPMQESNPHPDVRSVVSYPLNESAELELQKQKSRLAFARRPIEPKILVLSPSRDHCHHATFARSDCGSEM